MKILSSNIFFKANKMSQAQATRINDTLLNSNNVDVICHDSTDKDSAYSALSMQAYLNRQGVKSRIILSQRTSSLGVTNFENIIQSNEIDEIEKIKPDTVLCLDFGKNDRVSPYVLEHIKSAQNIVGFDHHNDFNMLADDYTCIDKQLMQPEQAPVGSYYVDTTAKSATSIVYRFFEALNEDVDSDDALKLFKGLADDCVKKGLLKCDGLNKTIKPEKKFQEDENAFAVYSILKNKLTNEQINEAINEVDVLSSLTLQQQQFKNSLKERLNVCDNGKVAFLEISPSDKEWQSIGGDNPTTSAILNRFRQEVLQENENIETVFVFYEAQGNYRLSVHSKNNKLVEFYDSAIRNLKYDGFSIGGHNDRGGGKISSTDTTTCSLFVKDILKCVNDIS